MKYTLAILFTLLFADSDLATNIFIEDLGIDFVPLAGHTNGQMAGYKKSTDQAALRLSNGTLVDLGTLGGSTSRATVFSPDGSEVLGYADNTLGSQNSFRYNGTIASIFGEFFDSNQAIGMDGAGNIITHFPAAGSNFIVRWNQIDSSTEILEDFAIATGVNSGSVFSGVDSQSENGFYHNGFTNFISPTSYNPSAGISDTGLTAGQLSSALAAYYQIGDPLALVVPNIFTLGATSEATGVTDVDLVFGNVGSTVFSYDVVADTITDLNSETLTGAPVNTLDDIKGTVLDGSFFFGEYTVPGLPTTHYYKATFSPVPEPSTLMLLLTGAGILARGWRRSWSCL